MKKILLTFCSLAFITVSAQDHFSGISTSKRVGILNVGMNPSELSNLKSKFEVQIFAMSANVSNDKISLKDLNSDTNLEDLIFKGDKSVNLNIDSEILGPGFAMRLSKWGFAVTTKGYIKANIIDLDTNLGSALANSTINSSTTGITINNTSNQRINSTSWGEVGFSASRIIFNKNKNVISGGITLKLLFPGSFANVGIGNFNGTITGNSSGELNLTNANAFMNVAYSGALANDFNDSSDYTRSVFGDLNGLATDIGINYILKDNDKSYKLKIGAAIKNLGSMTYKGEDNVSKNYNLKIKNSENLNLDVFDNVSGIKDIETTLLDTRFVTLEDSNNEFKVKLPTVFNLYADIKIISKLNLTLFMQQKMNSNDGNNQITSQNIFSVTPRISLGYFEAYIPVAINEISGTTGGFGFRLGGFFLGSNSVLTALTADTKQADFYTGFRWGFL